MTTSTTAYPLSWPIQWKRTPYNGRRQSQFRTKDSGARYGTRPKTIAEATRALLDELRLLGAGDVIISTNLLLRKDGLPRSDQRDPDDPGVAVYFEVAGVNRVMPCDLWDSVADNLYAVAMTIGAMRGIERWGVGDLNAHFAGFAALPAAGETSGEAWWQVLEVPATATIEAINQAFRAKARSAHPDAGGTDQAMSRLNAARDAGLEAREAK